jgi:hypothetical protein
VTNAGRIACIALCCAIACPAAAKLVAKPSYVRPDSAEYRAFKDWVDAAVAGSPGYGFSARDAVTMAAITGSRDYCELAVRLVEAQVHGAEDAIARGAQPEVANDSYLYAGSLVGDLAFTLAGCAHDVTDAQRQRWSRYANRTLENIWAPDKARWGERAMPWSGWATSDPGNNYFYSFLAATMYWALASDDRRWIDLLHDDKLPLLERYLAALPGGGSREGTGYGTSVMGLFDTYIAWRDGTGANLADRNAYVADTISYWIHATVPTLDRFAPIGDQARSSQPEIYDYQRCLMLEAAYLTHDAGAKANAAWWLANIRLRRMSAGFNSSCGLLDRPSASQRPKALAYHASGVGQVFARSAWTPDATWLAFVAGPITQSHAHQEQGGFTLFKQDWLAVTENVWTHSGIQQGTETNNVIRFVRDGRTIPQRDGAVSMDTTGTDFASGRVHATADLTHAYEPRSGVRAWKRTIDFADETLAVHDDFAVAPGTRAVFQINVPVKPVISGSDIRAGKLRIHVVRPENPAITSLDWSKLDKDEYRSGWRIDIEGASGTFEIEMTAAKRGRAR